LKIINNPKALREVPEKLFSLRLIKFMPSTLISEDLDAIKKFFNKNKKIIIKPIEGYSGNDVELLNKFNEKKISSYIKKYHHLMFQQFIPQISSGDKRIFIINGKVKGAISRIPKQGSILSNMSKGAMAKEIKITKQELKISKIVASELKKLNIYFAGIDFINGKLIGDINVTSPTGLKTYYNLTGINLAKYFFDNI
jgi:glutathione synthase